MKFTNFLHLSSQTLFVSLSLLSSNTYAASAANIQVNHCSECGQVLIGAARLDFRGIYWTSYDAVSGLNLNTVAQTFGFTGDSLYLSDTPPIGKNPWTFNSPRRVSISNPYFGDNMNHFFAPFEGGEVTASHEYVILSPTDSKTVTVTGIGVPDGEISPAITLNVVTNQGSTQVPCGDANICQVPVTLKGAARFTITPTVDHSRFSELALAYPGLQEVKYVLVKLRVAEKDTQCSRGYLSFKDLGVGSNSFKESDYYHYLEGGGPSHTPDACTRNYSFLVSVNKSFQFQATNNRDTGQNGYAEYAFYVNGHYDPNTPDLSKWVDSWKVVQLGNHFPPVTGEPITPPVTETPTTPEEPVKSFCDDQSCVYPVSIDKAGFYVASVNLAPGSTEGFWGLSVNTSSGINAGGFNAGTVLRENGMEPGFVAFYLAKPEAVNMTVFEYSGQVPELLTLLERQDINTGVRTTEFGPQKMTSGQSAQTSVLDAGFYVASASSQAGNSRGRFGISLTGKNFTGGVNLGGSIDTYTGGNGEGFGAFYVTSPQEVRFTLLFGNSYPTRGAGVLTLDIYSQDAEGKRVLYWTNHP